ncbi:ubiquitin-related modifier 1 [Trichomonascus vanleenenianus]|uniref:ubiquitin-related modifier URM1 n=1 Tax=Trichomonascus vanleenenianus TaxID=2268995 RepID=UPI003EC992D1
MKIKVEFSGGLEQLFGGEKTKQLEVEDGVDIKWLLGNLKDQMTDSRHDLFLQDDHVRPGILVLVNDADWELVGEEEYIIQNNDTILFASTLHGG